MFHTQNILKEKKSIRDKYSVKYRKENIYLRIMSSTDLIVKKSKKDRRKSKELRI